ncbi:MAG: hypothetical protein GY788_05125 [bacterium]|nr:hypothetical protein [bacterium]
MARRARLRFFLDNCVPDSVGRVLADAGHEVIYQREVIARDSPDTLVALTSAENDAILVTFDKDFRAVASRFRVSNRRLRKLSRIDFTCPEPQAAERMKVALSFIEAEWRIAKGVKDGRLFIGIGSTVLRTVR